MAERVRVRELSNQEGSRLLRIVRRDSGSVVTWRRAQMVLLAAQGMPAPRIAEVTSPARIRSVTSFGPFNLQPHPRREWPGRGGGRHSRAGAGAPPTLADTGCGTCWPPTP